MKRRVGSLAIVAALGVLAGFGPADRGFASARFATSIGPATGALQIWPEWGPQDRLQPAPQPVFSDSNTNKVVKKLQLGEATCAKLPSEYRVDCMAKALRDASQAASPADYRDVRKELKTASRALDSLVTQNADPKKPVIRVGRRTYRAVKKAALKPVNRRAAAIIVETETKLLRSSTSDRRKAHFQRIARAVGSTKTLLRS